MTKKTRKKLGILLMFLGILTGIIILVIQPDRQVTDIPWPAPGTVIREYHRKGGHMWEKIQFYLEARQAIREIQQKETMSSEDSLKLRKIDQQLNQWIHD